MADVSLHPEHLDALARDLDAYQDRLQSLLRRAAALDAAGDVNALAAAPAWAGRTSRDLRQRADLVRRTERMRLPDVDPVRAAVLHASCAPGPVPPLVAVRVHHVGRFTSLTEPGPYDQLPHEGLVDWLTRVLGLAAERYTPLGADEVTRLLRAVEDYLGVSQAVLATSWTAVSGAKLLAARRHVAPGLAGLLDLPHLRGGWLLSRATLPEWWWSRAGAWLRDTGRVKSPGTFPAWLLGPLERAAGIVPGELSRAAESHVLGEVNRRVRALQWLIGTGTVDQEALRALRALHPGATARQLRHLEKIAGTARGATNLVTVFRESGFTQALKTGGLVRAGGVVAQAGFTAVNYYDLARMDHGKAYREDKADYASKLAETAFNTSLTVAMVAPHPGVLVAVGVTGVAYAATEAWDHADEIKAWVGGGGPQRSLDAVQDVATGVVKGAGSLASSVGDTAGDVAGSALDAVKASPFNPMRW